MISIGFDIIWVLMFMKDQTNIIFWEKISLHNTEATRYKYNSAHLHASAQAHSNNTKKQIYVHESIMEDKQLVMTPEGRDVESFY